MLKLLLAPQFIGLYVQAVSTVYVHFRGRERLRLGRQLGDHSTYLAPYNVLMYAGSLRYHLGLVTPNSDKCRILVDGVPCVRRDGEAFMFDETFIHSAENATETNRIILFCDVERPMKYSFMTAMNRWVSHHIVKASATQNVEGEQVGVLNKVFGRLYEVHLFGRRIKEWNRRVYYALKYSLTFALLGLIVASALRMLLFTSPRLRGEVEIQARLEFRVRGSVPELSFHLLRRRSPSPQCSQRELRSSRPREGRGEGVDRARRSGSI
jgi:Aspartyl/Asparaginyl beta-hydroxylase